MTRERLMDAAYALFAAFGFKEVSVQQIMKHAQANRATFYLHFNDKLDIAWAITKRERGAQDLRFYKELDALEEPTLTDIRSWVERRVQSVSANPALSCIFQEAITSEARFASEYSAYLGRVFDRVLVRTLASQKPSLRQITRSKFILIVAMMDRFILHSCHHKLNFSGEASIEAITETLWDALFSKPRRTTAVMSQCAGRNEKSELSVG